MSDFKYRIEFKGVILNDLQHKFYGYCQTSDYDRVKYLLTSSKIANNSKIKMEGLLRAFRVDDLEMIKLIFSLDKTLNTQNNNERCFLCAYTNQSEKTLQYLMFELNLEKNEAIESHLVTYFDHFEYDHLYEKVLKWFNIREQYAKLNEELLVSRIDEKNIKKPKI